MCVKHDSSIVFLRLLRHFFFFIFALFFLSLGIRQVNDCTSTKIILQLCLCEILGSRHGVTDVMWLCVVGWVVPEVSKDRSAFIVKQTKNSGTTHPTRQCHILEQPNTPLSCIPYFLRPLFHQRLQWRCVKIEQCIWMCFHECALAK